MSKDHNKIKITAVGYTKPLLLSMVLSGLCSLAWADPGFVANNNNNNGSGINNNVKTPAANPTNTTNTTNTTAGTTSSNVHTTATTGVAKAVVTGNTGHTVLAQAPSNNVAAQSPQPADSSKKAVVAPSAASATPAPTPASTTTPAKAATPKIVDYTGPTIEKIKAANKIVIGNRVTSVPISYYDANKKPIGYGVDICLNFIERLKVAYDMPNLAVEFMEVSGDTRIPFLREGKVDIECGSTTNNADRRKSVDFTVPYYVAGVRILTKNGSGIRTLNDLRGKKVAVGKGTTSVKLMDRYNKERAMNLTVLEEKDFTSAFAAVADGRADAFVLDDLLLFGEKSKAENPQDFSVVGEFLSVEPLAIMVRKGDTEFKNFLDQYMVDLITSGKIHNYYKKWFESPIPPRNKSMDIPQTPLLKDIFRLPTSIVGN